VYHEKKCPYNRKHGSSAWLWIKDDERPIEKADRYLRQSGLERKGAEGWI